MKTLQIMAFITTGFIPLFSTLGQDSVAVEGKVIATENKMPIGAFTVKAYSNESASGTSTLISRDNKALAQTLTRIDGTYSLTISTSFRVVILQFEKLSYFSVPPQQTVTLALPKTTVPDVAAVKYSYGKTVSTKDLIDAFHIREASFNAMTSNLPPPERENARKKSIQFDIDSLQKSGVDSGAIMAVKQKFLPP
jgi:hypothetical protein